jgi:hypothetical protein
MMLPVITCWHRKLFQIEATEQLAEKWLLQADDTRR